MIPSLAIAGAVFLACTLEFSEALAAVFAASAKHGSALFPILGAVLALLVVLTIGAFASQLLTQLPSKPLHIWVGLTLIAVGAFWFKGAF